MTPGTLTLPIYRGAKWEHVFTFKQAGTETPVDLTGLGPFVFQVEDAKSGNILAAATVTSDYDATGVVTVSLPAATTRRFPAGTGAVRAGMRDALNNPYLQGTLDVHEFTPDPA